MSATLRIHRGFASPHRAVLVDGLRIGTLSDDITLWAIDAGHHVVNTALGEYRGDAARVDLIDGEVCHLEVVVNDDDAVHLAQGGFVRLERVS